MTEEGFEVESKLLLIRSLREMSDHNRWDKKAKEDLRKVHGWLYEQWKECVRRRVYANTGR